MTYCFLLFLYLFNTKHKLNDRYLQDKRCWKIKVRQNAQKGISEINEDRAKIDLWWIIQPLALHSSFREFGSNDHIWNLEHWFVWKHVHTQQKVYTFPNQPHDRLPSLIPSFLCLKRKRHTLLSRKGKLDSWHSYHQFKNLS